MYRFDLWESKDNIRYYQTRWDDFLRNSCVSATFDDRKLRYASHKIGEGMYDYLHKLQSQIELPFDHIVNRRGGDVYQEVGVLVLDVIIADRYDLNKRRI